MNLLKELPDFKLKFEAQTEIEFRKDYLKQSRVAMRTGYVLCILMYSAFGILDFWIVPETKIFALIIRFAVVIPVLILFIISTYHYFFKLNHQLLLIASSAVVGLGIVAMIGVSNPTELGYKYYYSGLILVLIWIYTFIRLRFWSSLIAGLIITAGYEIVAIFVQHLPQDGFDSENMLVFINNNFFFISANIIGLCASYNIEKIHRNNFLQRQTIQLQNNELQAINASKDKFFSIISHDLRGPFSSIMGLSNLLLQNLKTYNPEEAFIFVQSISVSSQKAYNLLENLLMWAKSQMGKIQYVPENLLLEELFAEAISFTENDAKAKNLTVVNKLRSSITFFADKNMISTVLRNLLSNSIKFTPKNGHVVINAMVQNNNIVVSVADTGVGMSSEKMDKLFKINEKVSTLGTEREPGTGLGLLLCKEFVEKHGGKIWLISEEGKGSDIKFSIPLH